MLSDQRKKFIRVYQLKILSVGITFGGPAILRYKDRFKEAVFLAFESPSWKVLFSLKLVDNGSLLSNRSIQDLKSFSSFNMAILSSSHHESLKAQQAINALFESASRGGHIISDSESASRGGHGDSSFQSLANKSITRFYFEFSALWPRTPSWISFFGSDTFYSTFERERTCPLCKALVKPADLRSFGDGSTSLFFQLF
ncbi:hypothetical protein HN51_011220 [Arachis hypogaea]